MTPGTYLPFITYAAAAPRGRYCPCGAGPVTHAGQAFAVFVDLGGLRPLCPACVNACAPELKRLLGKTPRATQPPGSKGSLHTMVQYVVVPQEARVEQITNVQGAEENGGNK